jgi:hypothetical protein
MELQTVPAVVVMMIGEKGAREKDCEYGSVP